MSECNYTYDISCLDNICRKFSVSGSMAEVTLLTQGHINKTFNVKYSGENAEEEYILQYVNSYVFKNPEAVMANTALVTRHIKNKFEKEGRKHARFVPEFFYCNGKNFYKDENGGLWRLRKNIKNSVSFSDSEDLYVIKEAGRAFGDFQNALSDFDACKLKTVILHFHNTIARFDALKAAAEADICGRFNKVKNVYGDFLSLKEAASKMYRMQLAGKLPLRVTHNDTKINNVLFDKDTKEYLAVIDLDTIMPGLVGFDYGDAIRYTANSAKEDEENLSSVSLDFGKFNAFTEGFIEKIALTATKAELNTLALGAVTMTVECGIRFLTDYLNGDKYFCIAYPEHNYVRSRCQLKLALNMLENYEKMNELINASVKAYIND